MSRAANVLRLSGLLGIVLGAFLGNVQFAYRSPMMLGGSQASPGFMVATHVHILGLSLIVLVISFLLDDAFRSRLGLVAGLLIVGQWVEPLSIYAVEGLQIGIAGLIGQLAALLNLLLFVAVAVNYYRNGLSATG